MIRAGPDPSARRGQPLVALALVLGSWVGARATLWEAPPLRDHRQLAASLPLASAPAAIEIKSIAESPVPVGPGFTPSASQVPVWFPPSRLPAVAVQARPESLSHAPPEFLTSRAAAGHQMLWLAGMAQLPLPAVVGPGMAGSPLSPPMPGPPERLARWSADGWVLLRPSGSGPVGGGLQPGTYGASQAGAVLRYRLAPGSAYRPAAYFRGSAALARPGEQELAAGLMLRPLPRLPITALAELRASRGGGVTRLRPALALVSELPVIALPLGTRLEAYGQAGYVGGSGATPFADGQARLERRVAQLGKAELRAGGGAWGGAQRGANRLDVGPTATLDLPLAGGSGRLSADWRFRLAGTATPGSGPALTLSAGF